MTDLEKKREKHAARLAQEAASPVPGYCVMCGRVHYRTPEQECGRCAVLLEQRDLLLEIRDVMRSTYLGRNGTHLNGRL